MFRIWIYLNFFTFLRGLFVKISKKEINQLIKKKITNQSKKKYLLLASQCRVGFLFILKYLKLKSQKREIIFCAYNLPEMINIAIKLNFKIIFCDLNYETGTMNLNNLKKKISKKTSAIVMTNMFNDYDESKKIKSLAKQNNITLIEDNAIYFDNYTKKQNLKIFSGSLGDFTIYSFNIMKNISSLYGGAISTSDKNFRNFYQKEYSKLKQFSKYSLIKQIFIFLVLKLMSIKIFYKIFFFHLIKFSHIYEIKIILKLFYPSLQSIRKKLPNYYYSKMSNLSTLLSFFQLKNIKERQRLFDLRKNKHNYFIKKLNKIDMKKISLIKRSDKNYQNFLDFPLLVKDKKSLNRFLLNQGIEVRYRHYYNCEKLFKKNTSCINSEKYEKELICLPLHSKISYSYIDYIIKNIEKYYLSSNKNV